MIDLKDNEAKNRAVNFLKWYSSSIGYKLTEFMESGELEKKYDEFDNLNPLARVYPLDVGEVVDNKFNEIYDLAVGHAIQIIGLLWEIDEDFQSSTRTKIISELSKLKSNEGHKDKDK